jgi:hypothetical protein
MQKLQLCLYDVQIENCVLKQENLKLKEKCEEYDLFVNQLQKESKEFSQCFFIFFIFKFFHIFILIFCVICNVDFF